MKKKMGIDEIFDQAKRMVVDEGMAASRKIAEKIANIIYEEQTGASFIALSIVQGGILGEIATKTPESIAILQLSADKIRDFYKELYVAYMKDNEEEEK